MVRRHGWQLPAHTFQVVAITVFFLLAIGFYVFFCPFLGTNALEYAAIAVYSPVAFAVFLLYVRCSAIDPSDPGIFSKASRKFLSRQGDNASFIETSLALALPQTGIVRSPGLPTSARSSSVSQSDKESNIKITSIEEGRRWKTAEGSDEAKRSPCLFSLGCLFCGWLVKDDNCGDDKIQQQPVAYEDVLFCTLCNTEVCKYSKHCRSCDKCVDGFDHHCRWLNNCVGKKNYITFVSLMASGLTLLFLDWAIGIVVLVRCFVDKRGTESLIIEKLGNSFSRAPFAAVVGLCTSVSLLASIALGELFFFHIILIRKGITTYEYVVAMRAQNEAQGAPEGDQQSLPSSPSSSTATGLSGFSSHGLQYRGAWCTPPRVFVEHQDDVVPQIGPGRVPSSIDPDPTTGARPENRSEKRAVRINAWKLAKLNPSAATRAVAKARESSSILRPVGAHDMGVAEMDYNSSSNISIRSNISVDHNMAGSRRGGIEDVVYSLGRPDFSCSRVTIKNEGDAVMQSKSNYSSQSNTTMSGSAALSHLPLEMACGATNAPSLNRRVQGELSASAIISTKSSLPTFHATTVSKSSTEHPSQVGAASVSDSYDVSIGESVDDAVLRNNSEAGHSRTGQISSDIRESQRTSVFWDHGGGRIIPSQNSTDLFCLSKPVRRQDWAEPSAVSTVVLEKPSSKNDIVDWSRSETLNTSQNGTSSRLRSLATSENLLYSGTSIFFGGPLNMPEHGSSQIEGSIPPSTDSPRIQVDSNATSARQATQANRTLRGSAFRSQSPVFVPRSMQTFSMFSQFTSS